MFTRIQWRIAASYTLLLGLVLLALGIHLARVVRADRLGALEAELVREARLVADGAQQRLAAGDAAGLAPLAQRLGTQIGARVTLIGADGTVLGDSDHDPSTMENHATRPEVSQALGGGVGRSQRQSATLETDLLYVAVPVADDGAILGVARVALPVSQVAAEVDRVVAAVAAALAVAVLLATGLAVILAQVVTGRLQALTQAAGRLALSALAPPIPVEGRDEVAVLARAFNDMAARLRAHVATVEEQRERLAAVLAHMADGVVIAGADGAVQLVNPAAARLLQIDAARAVGRSAIAVLRDHELAAALHEATAGVPGSPRLVELGLGARRRWVQAMATPIPGSHRTSHRSLLILQDVTELRRAETVRREFVANVSHELRTPVAALKALVETLEAGALEAPEVARDFLGRMRVEVDGLAQLVEELLELARIESGQTALRLEPVDVGALVATEVERLRPLAERQSVELRVCLSAHVAGDAPGDAAGEANGEASVTHADRERVRQVVANLVHNAVKFTPPGGRVEVSVRRRGDAVAVAVADTGIGIAPALLERIFERFYKADRARTGGGTGLGLAIAKHVVQAHGGRIWAESPGEGQGATFTFTLPLAAPLASSANAQPGLISR